MFTALSPEEFEARRAAVEAEHRAKYAKPEPAPKPVESKPRRRVSTGARHPLTDSHRAHIADALRRRRAAEAADTASPIRRARIARNLTVAEAAALLGISPTTQAAAETQPQLVSRKTMAKIEAEFGVTP